MEDKLGRGASQSQGKPGGKPIRGNQPPVTRSNPKLIDNPRERSHTIWTMKEET